MLKYSQDGCAALHYACRDSLNENIVADLLAAGANVNLPDSLGGLALHDAACFNAGLEVIRNLVESGTLVNSITLNGRSVWHFLGCSSSQYWPGVRGVKQRKEVADYLISHGARPSLYIRSQVS